MNTVAFGNISFKLDMEPEEHDIDGMLRDFFPEPQELVSGSSRTVKHAHPPASWGLHQTGPTALHLELHHSSSGDSAGAAINPDTLQHESPRSSARAARLAKKRMNQRIYREREKQQRAEANARLAELEALLAQLSVENSRLKLRNSALEKFVGFLDRLVAGLADHESEEMLQHPVFGRYGQVRTAQEMSEEEFTKTWRFIVMEAAALLMQIDAGDAAAAKELAVCVPLVEHLMFNLKVLHNDMMENLLGRNLETGEVEDPGPDFWVRVVRGLNLTDEQVGQMLDEGVVVGATTQLEAVRQRMLAEIGSLTARDMQCRGRMRAFFEGRAPDADAGAGGAGDGDRDQAGVAGPPPLLSCSMGMGMGMGGSDQVVRSLEKLLLQKNMLYAMLCSYVFNLVLTHRQKTVLTVSAYPYLVHASSVLEAVKAVRAERVRFMA